MKKFAFKKVYLFFSSLFIFCLHIPFVFAKSKPVDNIPDIKADNHSYSLADFQMWKALGDSSCIATNLYDSLQLGSLGLARQAFDYAIKGFNVMKAEGELVNENIISIIDFSKPSSKKRLFVIDLAHSKLLFNTYVAHGMQSGREFARQFSNKPESFKSSLGFYETLGTYIGGNGYSLRLEGVEKGINDNANKRAIVIHGAEYVNENMIRSKGYIGRSWGCPALPERLHKAIIDVIKNGTGLFIFSPDNNYLSHSRILNQSSGQLLAMNK
jgi:hypothetical protein